jgi:hypothetical protein
MDEIYNGVAEYITWIKKNIECDSFSDTKNGADSAVPDCRGFFHSFLLHFQDLQTAAHRGTESNHRYRQRLPGVVDRHRFDTDPDPDATFHFNADPDPDPAPSCTLIKKSELFFTFVHSSASLHCCIFLVSRQFNRYRNF